MARKLSMDRWMVVTVLFLTFFGLAMVFSASAMVSSQAEGNFTAFLLKQSLATALGLLVLFAATRIDYRTLRHPVLIWGLLATCAVLLLLVQFGGATAGGSRRWLNFGGFSFQPSELTKLALLIFLADLLARKARRLGDVRGFLLPCLALVGSFCALIYMQPDYGTTVTVLLITFCLFFIAGVPLRQLGTLAAGSLGLLAFLLVQSPYRLRRMLAYWYPDQDPLGLNFQINQSLIAVGSGGVTGVGLGESSQKLFFLPAAHTDFIFAVIGEELGFLGCLSLVIAFLILLWRGTLTGLRAPDAFGSYLAIGITLSLVLQAFINMGVVLALVPTKGLALPFVSYGGSSLLTSLLAAGFALNVSQQAR